MAETLHFLATYGYALLFAWVLAEQLGLPLPSAPLFLAAGALAGAGRISWPLTLVVAVSAALLGDLFWFRVGRRKGSQVLGFLCRISLEPDYCARRTQNVFARYGPRSLLVTKFIPWLNTAAPPLAGAFGMSLFAFLLYDVLGIALWAGTFIGLGYLFQDQLEDVAAYAFRFSVSLAVLILLGALLVYLTLKYVKRRRFLRQLQTARITPEELKKKLDSGEPVAILDLRHPLDFYSAPSTLPGAIRLPLEQLKERQEEIPHDREIVLYCTCPNEASSARAALMLLRQGLRLVRPLAGGFHGWLEKGFPTLPFDFKASHEAHPAAPIWNF